MRIKSSVISPAAAAVPQAIYILNIASFCCILVPRPFCSSLTKDW